MDRAICEAVGSRAVVQFSYGGGTRIVEPHCHGRSRTGKEVLRAYQIGGYSRRGQPVGWKLFEVWRISGVRPTGEIFVSNRPQYNPRDRGMISIHCHV
jgi:hypothetical protein